MHEPRATPSPNDHTDGTLPAYVRLPISIGLFLVGVAIFVYMITQPTDGANDLEDVALIFGNLLKGLMWSLPFTVGGFAFNTLFKPRQK